MIFPPADFPTVSGNVVRSAVDPTDDIYYAATDGGEVYAGVDGDDWELRLQRQRRLRCERWDRGR